MKTVCIDARFAQASGIGTYTRGLVRALSRQKDDLSFSTIVAPDAPCATIGPTLTSTAGMYSLSEQFEIPKLFRASGARLLHSTHYDVPIASVDRSVVTVHDLIHLKFPEFLPSVVARIYAQAMLKVVVPRARAILTVSEYSRRDIVQILNVPEEKVTVTPLGLAEEFRPSTPEEISRFRDRRQLPAHYFLYVGNLKEFKNSVMLLALFKRMDEQHVDVPPLVMVGKNLIKGFDQEIKKVRNVIWIPYLPAEDLPHVYSGATAFVFPSLYEGFGLPPLEAMACGAPVLCSNRASLPEVVGDAAILLDPTDPDAWQDRIKELAGNAPLREELRTKGLAHAAKFSWDKTAQLTRTVYQRCLA